MKPALIALGILALGVGCARFEPKPISATTELSGFENRGLSDAGLRAYLEKTLQTPITPWPPASWGFTNLFLTAFYYHPDLDVARAKWAGTAAGRRAAGERPNPILSVAPAYNTSTPTPSPWLVTAALDVPLETAGKRGYRIAQAGHLSEAARLNLASVAWQVRSRVRRALVELQAARALETLLAAQQELHAENVRLLEQHHQAGAISAFELTQARLGFDQARLAWRDAQRQSAETRVQLADALGLPARAIEGVELAFEGLSALPSDPQVAETRRQALLGRADVLGALAEYAAAQSALQGEIAKQYPDVHLGPGYEFDQGDNKWSLGASLTLPVFNRNQGAIAVAEAKRVEAAAAFNALQARVLAEIDRALAAYRAAALKQADAETLLVNVQAQEKTAQAVFAAGEISRSELAALRLQLSSAILARLEAVTKAQQAFGQLEDALQSPFGVGIAAWQISPRARPVGGHSAP